MKLKQKQRQTQITQKAQKSAQTRNIEDTLHQKCKVWRGRAQID